MIFESLDDALEDIDKNGNYNISDLYSHYKIDYHPVTDLPDNIRGYCLPLTRTIFINENSDYKYRTKNHELMHCLIDNTASPLLNETYVLNSKIEHRADYGAMYVMLKNYLNTADIEPEDFNIIQFCDACGVESKLRYLAGNVAERVLDIQILDSDFFY